MKTVSVKGPIEKGRCKGFRAVMLCRFYSLVKPNLNVNTGCCVSFCHDISVTSVQ